jgi:hypothetical protein
MLSSAQYKTVMPYLALLVLLSCLAGCAALRPTNWANDPDPRPNAAGPVTGEVRIISDSQIHESRGIPSRYLSLAGDEVIGVTIRSGQQVIGAADLLAVAMAGDYPLTLHLGDAIDLSCQSEWHRFTRVMQAKGGPGATTWLLAQGNHDGFLAGNISPGASGLYVDEYWNNMCNARGVVSSDVIATPDKKNNEKNFFKKRAVADAYYTKLIAGMKNRRALQDEVICDGTDLCVAHAFDNDWKSFVVQLVKLPASEGAQGTKIFALLLDSSDFNEQPDSPFGKIKAGERGGITAGQSRKAIALLKTLPSDAVFFIVSHHPFSDWRIASWANADVAAMKDLMGDVRFMDFILSAHEGGWYTHRLWDKALYELNTGSLADAPLYYRTLQFERDTNGGLIVHSRPIPLNTDLYATCANVPAPLPGSGYTAEEQKSVFERNSNKGPVVRFAAGFSSAIRHFFHLWRAKHTELRPQLLAYADVVKAISPDLDLPTPRGQCSVPGGLSARMSCLAQCYDGDECAVSDKGALLLALDNHYWNKDTPAKIRQDAHELRYCMATQIAGESADPARVEAILRNIEGDRRRLPLSRTFESKSDALNALRQP